MEHGLVEGCVAEIVVGLCGQVDRVGDIGYVKIGENPFVVFDLWRFLQVGYFVGNGLLMWSGNSLDGGSDKRDS